VGRCPQRVAELPIRQLQSLPCPDGIEDGPQLRPCQPEPESRALQDLEIKQIAVGRIGPLGQRNVLRAECVLLFFWQVQLLDVRLADSGARPSGRFGIREGLDHTINYTLASVRRRKRRAPQHLAIGMALRTHKPQLPP